MTKSDIIRKNLHSLRHWLNDDDKKEIFAAMEEYAAQQVNTITGVNDAFPLRDVLNLLAKATNKLLHQKNYDGPDYEEMELCVRRAEYIALNLPPPTLYRHYKGGLYELITHADQEDTGVPQVVFKSQSTGKVWVRPMDEFNDKFTPHVH